MPHSWGVRWDSWADPRSPLLLMPSPGSTSGFHFTSHVKSYCLPPETNKTNKKVALAASRTSSPRETPVAGCLADSLTSESGSALRSSACALTEKKARCQQNASSASRASDRSPDALSFRGSASLLDFNLLFSLLPPSRGRCSSAAARPLCSQHRWRFLSRFTPFETR